MDRQEKKSQRDLKRKVKKKKKSICIYTHTHTCTRKSETEREREKGRGREKIFAIDESVREGERKKERHTYAAHVQSEAMSTHDYIISTKTVKMSTSEDRPLLLVPITSIFLVVFFLFLLY